MLIYTKKCVNVVGEGLNVTAMLYLQVLKKTKEKRKQLYVLLQT